MNDDLIKRDDVIVIYIEIGSAKFYLMWNPMTFTVEGFTIFPSDASKFKSESKDAMIRLVSDEFKYSNYTVKKINENINKSNVSTDIVYESLIITIGSETLHGGD